jgi:hypothetical protein
LAVRPGTARSQSDEQDHRRKKDHYEAAHKSFHHFLCNMAVFKQIEATSILTEANRQQHSLLVESAFSVEPLGPSLDEFAISQSADADAVAEARKNDFSVKSPPAISFAVDDQENLATDRFRQQFQKLKNKASNSPARPKGRPLSQISVHSVASTASKQPRLSSAAKSDPDDKTNRIKEGYLYVSSKALTPSATATPTSKWAKRWMVLDKGTLNEYGEFREGQPLERKDASINLNFACVKQHPMVDRRWTFSVTTTECVKLYQATSQEEAESWVSAASMQIESLLSESQTFSL